ncbi:MAG: thiamine pyrophosphate-requiring protein [Alphaproteobacteria bacterium]|nr:thiamine pyrophosphate-requiring protein [Alphaproteobacteria bacterium]
MPIKTIASGTVADAYLALLAERGIEYLFANAGTDFAPIIEAYAKAQVFGTRVPKPVTVPHENVAINMAQGYYLKTGRPQAVMVHVNVGTANAICGLVNGWRGNIPVLFTAGRTPFTEEGGVPGERSGEIHWPQEMRDQRAMVREFVKWDYELPNGHVLESAVDRALNIAMSEPRGPVYMTLPREVLAAPIADFRYSQPSRHQTPSPPAPDANAIDAAAAMIAAAENPVIVTNTSGRDEGDVAKLAALTGRFAIPVALRKARYMCLPTAHPMNLGEDSDNALDAADLVLVLDCEVPWIPKRKAPREECKIIHAGADPIFENYPLRGFKCDLAITGVPGVTLPALEEALAAREKSMAARVDARRKWVAQRKARRAEELAGRLEKVRRSERISQAWINRCISQVKGDDGIVLKEALTSNDYLEFTKAGTFYSLGQGGALGWSLGTSLGVKTAVPDRLVICAVGDGSYMFGNPLPAHYVGKAENLPTLTVVYNNEMWNAVRRNTRDVYPDGYAAKSNREPLTYFDPGTRYEKAIEALGGYGEQVVDGADLPRALDRALNKVAAGQQALLNVVCT